MARYIELIPDLSLVSTSSNNASINNDLIRAIDGDDSTAAIWVNKSSSTSYIQFDIPNFDKPVNKVAIKSYMSTSHGQKVTLYGSNDNQTYVELGTTTNWLYNNEAGEFEFPSNKQVYKHYRIMSSFQSGSFSIGLYYLKFYTLREHNPETEISFHKTSMDQIPEDSGYDQTNEVHFTMNNGIFTYDNEGMRKKVALGENDLIETKETLKVNIDAVKDELKTDIKNKSVLGASLNYCNVILSQEQTEGLNQDDLIRFDTFENNEGFKLGDTPYTIKLEKGKTYSIIVNIDAKGKSNVIYLLKDITNSIDLTSCQPVSCENDVLYGNCINYIYTAPNDCEIGVSLSYVYIKPSAIHARTMMTIQEIGRTHVIDPAQITNQEYGIEDSPVGHIMSFMGTVAPKHYLFCDGAEYNIADYPKLAEHFLNEFGSINHFGGDGVTTFAVPDLRGEFLRGTGINSHENQSSGMPVGEHQDGTRTLRLQKTSNGVYSILAPDDGTCNQYANENTEYSKLGSVIRRDISTSSVSTSAKNNLMTYYPTNTSVLYCIKYEPTYYMSYSQKRAYFDKDILFDGEATTNQTIILSNNISDYDFLIVSGFVKLKNEANVFDCTTNFIPVDSIHLGMADQFTYNCSFAVGSTNYERRLRYHFETETTFKIDSVLLSASESATRQMGINKIYGIKGSKDIITGGGSIPAENTLTSDDVTTIINEVWN